MSQLLQKIGPAIVQALIVCIVRFFTIPLSIWKGAALRLADRREAASGPDDGRAKSEFPVLDWIRTAWDGMIFLSWFVGAVAAILTLLGGMFSFGFLAGIGSAFAVLVYFYFSVILMSFFKESLILILSIATNVEKLVSKPAADGPAEAGEAQKQTL